MAYAALLQADIRLVILRTLAELPANRGNSSVLCSILDAKYGHAVTRDKVKTELRWLEEQGLVTIEEAGSVLVATLTERGADVASGRARVDGVKRPGA